MEHTRATSDHPLIATATMGYGHLRAAAALVDRVGGELLEADRPPHASPPERLIWRLALLGHTHLSRWSQLDAVGRPFHSLLEGLTAIPPELDGAASLAAARQMEFLLRRGFGRRLARRLQRLGRPVISTFYAPALALDRYASVPVASLVTDTEAHRVWAPLKPASSRLTFLAPTAEVERRLVSYGVRPETIRRTGFPLPPELADERSAAANRDRRIRRLQAATLGWRSSSPDHIEPLRLTVAIGGAAAQSERIHGLVGALGPLVSDGRVRLDLVAGTDAALAKRFRRWTAALRSHPVGGLNVSILHHPRFDTYSRRFNELLAATDLLWTKPSEMVFYAALGLPLVLDDPVGHHEWHNRRWVLSSGAAMLRPDPRDAAEWLEHELLNGTFQRAVEDGFSNLPRDGADRVADWLQSEFTDR